MITNATEYAKAREELEHLEDWLKRLEREHPLPDMGLSKAGIQKMIARLYEELGEYEGTLEVGADRCWRLVLQGRKIARARPR